MSQNNLCGSVSKVYEVLGRQFRTATDYNLAKRDAEYIEQIKRRYDLQTVSGVEALYRDLKSKKYQFRTILGEDFLDETEDLLKKRRAMQTSASTQKSGKKKGTAGKKTKKVSLEDYDPDMQKYILLEMKKQERNRKLLMLSCLCVAFVCFGYLALYSYQTQRLDEYAETFQSLKGAEVDEDVEPEKVIINYDNEEIVLPEILDEYKKLFSLNKNLIGWIKIADTYIDYPVLQTNNNDFYLKHNFNHESDRNGSIFLDKDCSVYPRSTNLILYGHHMRNGRMFGQLNKYSSVNFYKQHKYIQFDTIYEKGTYEVMYVFRSRIYEETSIVFKYYQFIDAMSETEFDSYMREMAEMSLYDTGVTAQYGDELLTLSTCDYYTDNGRFVVVAKKVE